MKKDRLKIKSFRVCFTFTFLVLVSLFKANAQEQQIIQKTRFTNGLAIPITDSSNFTDIGDSAVIFLQPSDSAFYYKYQGYFKKLVTLTDLLSYSPSLQKITDAGSITTNDITGKILSANSYLTSVLLRLKSKAQFSIDVSSDDLTDNRTIVLPDKSGKVILDADTIELSNRQYQLSTEVQKKQNRFILNVKDYGATGDGLTDDLLPIQAALDEAGSSGGGIVYIPQGIYYVTNVLLVPSKVILSGAGSNATIIRNPGGDLPGKIVNGVWVYGSISLAGVSYSGVRDIQVDHFSNNTHANGIILVSDGYNNLTTHCFIEHCRIEGVNKHSYLIWNNRGENNIISNNFINGNTEVTDQSSEQEGIEIYGGKNVQVINNQLRAIGANGVYVSEDNVPGSYTQVNNILIKGNQISRSRIGVRVVPHTTTSNITISSNQIEDLADKGIFVSSAETTTVKGMIINDNIISNVNTFGIELNGGGSSFWNSINVVSNNISNVSSAVGAGVYIHDVSNIDFRSNIVSNTENSSLVITLAKGINISSNTCQVSKGHIVEVNSCENVSVSENKLSQYSYDNSNTKYGVYVYGPTINATISSNTFDPITESYAVFAATNTSKVNIQNNTLNYTPKLPFAYLNGGTNAANNYFGGIGYKGVAVGATFNGVVSVSGSDSLSIIADKPIKYSTNVRDLYDSSSLVDKRYVDSLTATLSGITSSIGAINGKPKSSTGMVVSAGTLYNQTADTTYPGLVGTGPQIFAGLKTFTSYISTPEIRLSGLAYSKLGFNQADGGPYMGYNLDNVAGAWKHAANGSVAAIAANSGGLEFYTNTAQPSGSNALLRGKFDVKGNFGINNNSPSEKLDVNGAIKVSTLYSGSIADSIVVWNPISQTLNKVTSTNYTTTIGPINGYATKSNDGIVFSNGILYAQIADEKYSGLLSASTQKIGGIKSFTDYINTPEVRFNGFSYSKIGYNTADGGPYIGYNFTNTGGVYQNPNAGSLAGVASNSDGVQIYTNTPAAPGTRPSVKIAIDNAGNLGINTQTPVEKLDVNGKIRVTTLSSGRPSDSVVVWNEIERTLNKIPSSFYTAGFIFGTSSTITKDTIIQTVSTISLNTSGDVLTLEVDVVGGTDKANDVLRGKKYVTVKNNQGVLSIVGGAPVDIVPSISDPVLSNASWTISINGQNVIVVVKGVSSVPVKWNATIKYKIDNFSFNVVNIPIT